ncbi:MAG: hypothetical protein U5K75_01815 [Ahrensia sp.]|nr:hypothetical protein [Ahrensia sp.]
MKTFNHTKSVFVLGYALTLMATTPLHSAETGIQFSAYVPPSAGDLSFGPLRAYAEGTGNEAGLQLTAANHGTSQAELQFEAFDGHFNKVNDIDLPETTTLYPGESRQFLAIVPIMEDVKSRYRICATLKSPSLKQTKMCGKYISQKR